MAMLVMNAHRWNKERKTSHGKTRDNDKGTHWAHTKTCTHPSRAMKWQSNETNNHREDNIHRPPI